MGRDRELRGVGFGEIGGGEGEGGVWEEYGM